MPPRRPSWFRESLDELPRSGVSDPPLSLEARTPGRRGLPRKLLLAALGLLAIFALVAAMWLASHFSPRGRLQPPPAQLSRTL